MTKGEFVAAAPVVTWTAVGVFFYGVYLLTSIGLNITSNTRYYPLSTAIGAGVNVALNLMLVPGYGILGAAWANGIAYGIQSAVAFNFSRRFYPIPYEWGRISRALAGAVAGWLAATSLPSMAPLPGFLARGTTVVLVTFGVLWFSGFFRPAELNELRRVARRWTGRARTTSSDTTEMAGEIVSVDIPDELIEPPPDDRRR
jgi:O-antigen/teichoic acid export membrane protein